MSQTRTSAPARSLLPGSLLLVAALVAAILPARADSSAKYGPAESYIAEFFRATVATAVASQSDEYATNAVKVLLLREVPLDETARFMLGRAWPTTNKPAALRFQEEFHDFVAEAVARSLRANPTAALEVSGSRTRPDGTVLVLSSLNLPSGAALPIDWQVARDPQNGTFQITDIAILGIDAAIMLRSMAGTMLAEGKTGIDDLIPRLRAALVRRTGADAASPAVTSP